MLVGDGVNDMVGVIVGVMVIPGVCVRDEVKETDGVRVGDADNDTDIVGVGVVVEL